MQRSPKFPFRWVVLTMVLLAASSGHAQLGIYGMGTGGHESGPGVGPRAPLNGNGSFIAWGGTAGLYSEFLHLGPARLGADGRFFVERSGNSTPYGNKLQGGVGGLRASFGIPLLRPYMQAEIGGASSNNGTDLNQSTGFCYQVQFGLDFTIFPHVDLRGEYGVGQILLQGRDPTLQQFGGGLVIRL